MDVIKYEKSLDNRCAALVSREGSAPRAGHNRKPFIDNGLRLISLLIMARGAQVSRAARGSNARFSRPACRALLLYLRSGSARQAGRLRRRFRTRFAVEFPRETSGSIRVLKQLLNGKRLK
jgi:hypothetical protein